MSENTLRAVLWDQMHYMLRRYNDRMTHIALTYEGEIDPALLKGSLQLLLNASPVLHSRFVPSPVRPFWRVTDCSAAELLSVYDTETPDEDAMEFLLREIPPDSPGQLRMGLFRNGRHQVLALLTNHMCMDASDTLYFLRTLCRNYDALAGYGSLVPIRTGSRSHAAIYADLSPADKLRTQLFFRYRGKIRSSPLFPQTPSAEDDRRRIVYRVFSEELSKLVADYAARSGATRHEVLTAATLAVLYDMCSVASDRPLAVSCAVNLRRHRRDHGEATGLTNHVAWMRCRVGGYHGDFSALLEEVKSSMQSAKNDPYLGLYSLPLLNLGCSVLPIVLTEPIAARVYSNPPLGISNIGRLSEKEYSFRTARLTGGHLTGAVKRKPAFFLTVCYFDRHFLLSDAFFGSEEDAATVERFYDKLEELLFRL